MVELMATKDIPRPMRDGINLFEFQNEGVDFFTMTNGNALLGDDMGLGKTIQSIYWCNKYNKKAVIVAPASALYNWKNEIEKFTHSKSAILDSKTVKKIIWEDNRLHYLIISYDYLKYFVKMEKRPYGEKYRRFYFPLNSLKEIIRLGWDTVIMDEVHFTGNESTQRSKMAMLVGRQMKYKLCLSGTPIKNKPIEFFPVLNLLLPDTFSNWRHYAIRYCGAEKSRFGLAFKNASNLDELNRLVQPIFLRRKKEEVLDQLPSKTRDIRFYDLENHPEYGEILTEIIKAENDWAVLRGLTKMRMVLGTAMMAHTIEFVNEILENTDSKIIVGSMFKETLKLAFQDKIATQSLLYTGDLNKEQKNNVLEQFNKDPNKRVLWGTISSMGVGLNIQIADKVIFNDVPWTPADSFQFEDRAYRNGQKNNVNVYYMGYKDTYYETMFEIINNKNALIETILEGEVVTRGDVLKQVIKFIKSKA